MERDRAAVGAVGDADGEAEQVAELPFERVDVGTRIPVAEPALALAAGVALNFAILWLADPGLPTRVQRGVQETLAMVPRNPAQELAALAMVELPKAVIASLRILLWPVVLAALAFAIGILASRRSLG